jgi:iron complex outermembrane receptor protein
VLGRWEHEGERASTRLQLFVDHTDRDQPPSGVGFELDTYDLDFQQSLNLGERHRVVWGLGRRQHDYDIVNTPALAFSPAHRTLNLTNVFAQDTIALGSEFRLTAGVKFEENSIRDGRRSRSAPVLGAQRNSLLWARRPCHSCAHTLRYRRRGTADGTTLFIVGDPEFRTEKVDSFEIGYRSQPNPRISWSLSTFYNKYDDLRTIEPAPGGFLPLHWGNSWKAAPMASTSGPACR